MRRTAATTAALAFLLPLLAGGADFASSGTAAAAAEPPLTDIRREMLSEYRFSPPGTEAAPLPTSLHSEAPAPPDGGKDIVSMEPFEVHESRPLNSAYPPLAQKEPDKAPSTVAAKLGIGTHSVQLGKVRLFVNTVFYVPFLAGFSW